MTSPITIPNTHQGPTGRGQGGWTCFELARVIGQPVTIALRAAIPLDTELSVVRVADDRWQLVDPTAPASPLLEAATWEPAFASTEPVSIEQAHEARSRFAYDTDSHPAPNCLSCGLGPDSMRIHAGELADGRWATPWTASARTLDDNGGVSPGYLWMAMDCCQGFSNSPGRPTKTSVTVQYAVQVHAPLEPDADYAVVAHAGTYKPGWDGRKKGAGATVFDRAGHCVAESSSFWVAIPD